MSGIEDQTIVFRLLEHRGVKLQRFAEMIGFSYAYVYSIMVGRRAITEEFRRRCVSYFQIPEGVLFVPSARTNVEANGTPDAPPHAQAGRQGRLRLKKVSQAP